MRRYEDMLEKALTEIREKNAEIERLQSMTKWQPIETAPKDGTIILICIDGNVDAVYWGLAPDTTGAGMASKVFPWVCLDETNGVNALMVPHGSVAHWMPLPPPPASEDRAA